MHVNSKTKKTASSSGCNYAIYILCISLWLFIVLCLICLHLTKCNCFELFLIAKLMTKTFSFVNYWISNSHYSFFLFLWTFLSFCYCNFFVSNLFSLSHFPLYARLGRTTMIIIRFPITESFRHLFAYADNVDAYS